MYTRIFVCMCVSYCIHTHTHACIYADEVSAVFSCSDNPSQNVWKDRILPILEGTCKAAPRWEGETHALGHIQVVVWDSQWY